MKNLSILVTLFLVIQYSCSSPSPLDKYDAKIFSDIPTAKIKKNIHIRVKEQLSEHQLTEIGNYLKKENSEYKSLFIFYLLPEMEKNAGAWAYTHFTPELELKIMGATKEEESQIVSEAKKIKNAIGKWQCKQTGLEHSLILVKNGDSYKSIQLFKDGSEGEEILIKSGNKFTVKDNKHGEYYILNDNGDMEYWDPDGLFTTAKRLEN